ncbi:OLC1v1035398C1 [Oldenlandia corymbosa var. corymbosa]|uniref:OLC1v1035398C1 n=1 Tax=Oldenlandia corymbosa var. corymbosa TaxID=529605 RepID=A0AAV1CTE5_OLDCO|nr:OLC1v1035398C1 [Oldenlandia corymbosa var. corymbosa]
MIHEAAADQVAFAVNQLKRVPKVAFTVLFFLVLWSFTVTLNYPPSDIQNYDNPTADSIPNSNSSMLSSPKLDQKDSDSAQGQSPATQRAGGEGEKSGSSAVLHPLDLSSGENSQYEVYKDYNFNISMVSSPYLLRSEMSNPDDDVTSTCSLYLDESVESWSTKLESYDYVIISSSQRFFWLCWLYENRTLIGCTGCKQGNVYQFDAYFSCKKAFRTAFRAISGLRNYKDVTFLRTITPSHFASGEWDEGGDCLRRKRSF